MMHQIDKEHEKQRKALYKATQLNSTQLVVELSWVELCHSLKGLSIAKPSNADSATYALLVIILGI